MKYGLVLPISIYFTRYDDAKEKGSINIDWFKEKIDNFKCCVPTNRWLILYTWLAQYIVQGLKFHFV